MPVAATPLAIVAHVPDRIASAQPSAPDAQVAVARLEAMSVDVRGCAILGPGGRLLAASGDPETWEAAAGALLAAADAAAGEPATQAHVGTEDGEAFAVRHQGFAIVVAAERFTLASLMVLDMRTVLRDLLAGPAGNGSVPAANGAG